MASQVRLLVAVPVLRESRWGPKAPPLRLDGNHRGKPVLGYTGRRLQGSQGAEPGACAESTMIELNHLEHAVSR